ncbi:N-acetylmuramoyl-L-alanine amidase AmiC precursor [Pseudooctadecabacter jejudonensis]|uniref:N-acetylmuramoyl-L-alanine amidase n=2 Tax=Pseudooctadecabacter jejudonensis TaxID=1391910 RepID=A0A1Y5R937_9RHOB|nr:N-acetylmuramoyl-L-alanine amidase AmiC precursor [Pseudooctadecabacter jejudonensis]
MKTGGLSVAVCLSAAMCGGPLGAQELSGLARVDGEGSVVEDVRRRTELTLFLSQVVPYRVFTLDAPRRLVVDFREVDFRGLDAGAFDQSDHVSEVRFGALRPGWSRMVVDLSAPLAVEFAGMQVDDVDGTALVEIVMRPTSETAYAAAAGAPQDPEWAFLLADPEPAPGVEEGPVVVMIDPGHGGLDPGAEHGGTQEADIMLATALELAAALERVEGVRPALTRSADVFVPLQERLTLARRAGADLFISLHADALEGEQASGASVYTLTSQAASAASLRMAERHEAGDLLAGVDLSGQGDEVALILQDLARVETAASGDRFADQMVQAMADVGAPLNTRPRRMAPLAVLNAADFASVLIEVGFLSNAEDRARLSTAEGRAPIVAAAALAIQRWAAEEAALAPLVRQ